ncbi:TPA: hypothetical protein ACLE2D_002472 [Citrobacter freundii]
MAHEISLAQAAERAHQAEIICRMMESYPDRMVDTEIIAIATLLRRLTGDVCAWLIEEQATKEKNK